MPAPPLRTPFGEAFVRSQPAPQSGFSAFRSAVFPGSEGDLLDRRDRFGQGFAGLQMALAQAIQQGLSPQQALVQLMARPEGAELFGAPDFNEQVQGFLKSIQTPVETLNPGQTMGAVGPSGAFTPTYTEPDPLGERAATTSEGNLAVSQGQLGVAQEGLGLERQRIGQEGQRIGIARAGLELERARLNQPTEASRRFDEAADRAGLLPDERKAAWRAILTAQIAGDGGEGTQAERAMGRMIGSGAITQEQADLQLSGDVEVIQQIDPDTKYPFQVLVRKSTGQVIPFEEAQQLLQGGGGAAPAAAGGPVAGPGPGAPGPGAGVLAPPEGDDFAGVSGLGGQGAEAVATSGALRKTQAFLGNAIRVLNPESAYGLEAGSQEDYLKVLNEAVLGVRNASEGLGIPAAEIQRLDALIPDIGFFGEAKRNLRKSLISDKVLEKRLELARARAVDKKLPSQVRIDAAKGVVAIETLLAVLPDQPVLAELDRRYTVGIEKGLNPIQALEAAQGELGFAGLTPQEMDNLKAHQEQFTEAELARATEAQKQELRRAWTGGR